jgi:sigma-B regulation protein RsbU (phosphoserine phosphatase)
MPERKILDKVVSVSVQAVGAEQGTISLVDEAEIQSQDPFKTLIRKIDVAQLTKEYRLGRELSAWMIRNCKPLLINDFSRNESLKISPSVVDNIQSLVSVPMLCKGELIGVLNVFNKKGGGEFSQNDQRLLAIIASQSAQVLENARLYEQEKQLREFEKELDMARTIQKKLLPKDDPVIPGFDITGTNQPAREVGGDYFDFIELRDGRLGIALGDVSGKGIPAAMLVSTLQATLRNQALSSDSIVDCVSKTNYFLYHNTEPDRFATLFYCILYTSNGNLVFVNAGHNPPLYLSGSGEFQSLSVSGILLGAIPVAPYEKRTITLKPGEILVIYSDGVTEAEDKEEVFFGEEKVREIIRVNRDLSAAEILANIQSDVRDHQGSAQQDDDITIVIIKRI